YQKRRHADRRELGESNRGALRLRLRARLLRIVMNIEPALETLGVRRHVAHAHFAKLRRPAPEIRQGRLRAEFAQLFIDDGAAAGGDLQAAQALGMPERVIVRREAAAGDADQMKAVEL